MKKKFSCGHKGLGGYCHRCELANKLEALLKEGKQYVTSKDHEHPKKWSKEEVLAEIKRLRMVGNFTPISES